MYFIKTTKELKNNSECLEVSNSSNSVFAKISLSQGASLQELTLGGHPLIKDLEPLTYDTTYASSILFPFANRIKDGDYAFDGENYQFDINEKNLNNALHGLVFNKTFEFVNEVSTETMATVSLAYHEKNKSKGFPFLYSIYLDYVFTNETLTLRVSVKNTDTKSFPFTLGWHPYFLSRNLFESIIMFDATNKTQLDDRNITEKTIPNKQPEGFQIKDQFLDDCYILDTNSVTFKTPNYVFELKSSEKACFLQLYTPPVANTIAIEPTTGVSDSFNNGIGLKKLKSHETYSIDWYLHIKNN